MGVHGHTGDFAFYRAYVGPDGEPADPSPDNVPFQPEHWLRTATEAMQGGDLVMVAGYPGSTSRNETLFELEQARDWYYPTMVELLDELLAAVEETSAGKEDREVKSAGKRSVPATELGHDPQAPW